MCGIAGIVAPVAARYNSNVDQMKNTLVHRGPDNEGKLNFTNCLLAHRRLSIIDLSSGHQPLLFNSAQGQLGITFNGEIYNYRELRAQLSGQSFSTNSDTEVIPALYERGKEVELCRQLVGMFAFAIWDEAAQRLICARDRFGEKPFYYSITREGTFLFASEIQALIASGLIDDEISNEAISSYLSIRFIPDNLCIYKNIHVLEPGCVLVWDAASRRLKIERYWTLPEIDTNPPSLEEAGEELRYLLRRAVERCMVADVEVGLLLSGGLDSTSIAYLAAQQRDDIHSFSFGFEGGRDERPYALDAAKHYGLKHLEMDDGVLDVPSLLEQMPKIYNEPFGDNSALPTWLLCRQVRQHVKVAMGGDGADELLAGYDYWYRPLLTDSGKKSPKTPIAALKQKIKNWFRYKRRSEIMKRHWQQWNAWHFSDGEIAQLGLPRPQRLFFRNGDNTVHDAFAMDIRHFLPSDILKKVDRSAMSHGLELRSPFLDRDVASFLASLPYQYKISPASSKLVLRESFEQNWPESIQNRPKQGFGCKVSTWLSQPVMKDFRYSYLRDRTKKIQNLFPTELLERYSDDVGNRGWLILNLAIWLESFPWHASCDKTA